MKNPRFIQLLLSTLLSMILSTTFVLPGFAQQTDSNADAQPTSSNQSAREPLTAPPSRDFWDGDDPNLVNLVTHPFANKKYVNRMVGPIRDRINELDQLTSENGKMIKDTDERATQGIQLASEKVSLADQHATEANSKAQTAQTSATAASTHVQSVEQMVGNIDQYKGEAQTEIRFRAGQSVLSKEAKDALDQMASPLTDQHSYIIEVRGFAAGRGSVATATSRKMADSVVRYLVLSHQIPVYRIYVMSLGNAQAAAADGTMARHGSGGRVEVSVMKNEVSGMQH